MNTSNQRRTRRAVPFKVRNKEMEFKIKRERRNKRQLTVGGAMTLTVQVAILKTGFNGSALTQLGISRKELKLGSSDSTFHPLLHKSPGPMATCFDRQYKPLN